MSQDIIFYSLIVWAITGAINTAISAILFTNESRVNMFVWWFISGFLALTMLAYVFLHPKGDQSKIFNLWIKFTDWIETQFFDTE